MTTVPSSPATSTTSPPMPSPISSPGAGSVGGVSSVGGIASAGAPRISPVRLATVSLAISKISSNTSAVVFASSGGQPSGHPSGGPPTSSPGGGRTASSSSVGSKSSGVHPSGGPCAAATASSASCTTSATSASLSKSFGSAGSTGYSGTSASSSPPSYSSSSSWSLREIRGWCNRGVRSPPTARAPTPEPPGVAPTPTTWPPRATIPIDRRIAARSVAPAPFAARLPPGGVGVIVANAVAVCGCCRCRCRAEWFTHAHRPRIDACDAAHHSKLD
ncbi:hypothetical protein ACHAWF_004452, partial [Thalassiosira exigua]